MSSLSVNKTISFVEDKALERYMHNPECVFRPLIKLDCNLYSSSIKVSQFYIGIGLSNNSINN